MALEPAGGACALPLGAMAEQGEGEEASGPSVLFLHPDLGLGGAERLVVDAALALKARGCQVQVWTAHYDPGRCFAETRQLAVHCAGAWLPRSFWGRGHAVCAALRMVFVALYVLLLSGQHADAFICDQVRAAAILRGRAGAGGNVLRVTGGDRVSRAVVFLKLSLGGGR